MTFPRSRFKSYSPGRVDARTNEAMTFLKLCRDPNTLMVSTFRAQFNLKPDTAEKLVEYEKARRNGGN